MHPHTQNKKPTVLTYASFACPEVKAFITCNWRESNRHTNRWGRHKHILYVNLYELLVAHGSPVLNMNGRDLHAESMKYTEHHKDVNVTQLKTVVKIRPMR
jgi:hypothetical protein